MLISEKREKFHEEIARRMAEPEILQELRRQKDRLLDKQRRAARAAMDALAAEQLRREIRGMGEEPVA